MERQKQIANRGRIMVAKVGLDGHDRGARVLSRMLAEEGFEVVFVGVRHTPEQVADIALRDEVDVVGISVLSGAQIELSAAVRRALDARGLSHVPIALGGLIPRSDADALKQSGVAMIFHPGDETLAPARIAESMDELVEIARRVPDSHPELPVKEIHMKVDPVAGDSRLFYPGRNLSDAEKKRMDEYNLTINDLTVDHIVYSMSRQIEMNFQIFYTVAGDLVGEEKALEIAREIGLRYGARGYSNFLKARGMEGAGNPETMAQYQDLVHSIRGPKHTAALFAQFDDEKCVIKRNACIYYNEQTPENGKYTAAFEQGCFAGYKAADKNLKKVEVRQCLCKGNGSCEQHWIYKE